MGTFDALSSGQLGCAPMASSGAGTNKRRRAPRMPPAERREQVLDAALSVIAERGYGGVSMEAIARAAEVTKPVVYDLYANRGELLRALLQREEERALGLLAELMPAEPASDPDQLAIESFRAFLESVAANPTSWRLILLPTEGTPELVREHVESGREAVRARIERLLEWGLEGQAGSREVDLELASFAFLALGEQFARLVLTDPERYSPARIDAFVAALFAALEAPGSAS